MRYWCLVAVAVMAVAFAFALPSADATDDEPLVIEVDDLSYMMATADAVQVLRCLDEPQQEDVVIPDSIVYEDHRYKVIAIMAFAFFNDFVKSVTVPYTVEWIEEDAFYGKNIERIDVDERSLHFASSNGVLFDKSMMTLLQYPFAGSEVYTVPSTVSKLADGCFASTGIRSITLDDNLASIGAYAFSNCANLEEVLDRTGEHRLPGSLMVIGDSAFYGCSSLNQIKMPQSVMVIGWGAFRFSGIETMDITDSVYYVGNAAFSDCPNLKSISALNSRYFEEDGVLFEKKDKIITLICYPAGKEGAEYTISAEVDSVAMYAFSGCNHLKTIILPKQFTSIPEYAFAGCTSLENIDISNISVIGPCAFLKCENLKSVVFGTGLYDIGYCAYEGTGISTVFIPASVRIIDFSGFYRCMNLREVTFAEGCTADVGEFCFLYCISLEKIYVESPKVTFGEYSLCIGSQDAKHEFDIVIPKGYEIPDYAYDEDTILNIIIAGEKPYPYENFIGVAFCVLILIAILRFVREV